MHLGLRSGKLIRWKEARGFGFIQPADGGQDIFLHISDLQHSTRRPKVGDTICYYTTLKDGKVRACRAFIVGERKITSSTSTQQPNRHGDRYPISMPTLFGLSIIPVVGIVMSAVQLNPLPILLYPGASFLTFLLYARDKSLAQQKRWRISESTLHLFEIIGGWIGGYIAQQTLHHKNRKRSYQQVFWFIVSLHQVLWIVLIIRNLLGLS